MTTSTTTETVLAAVTASPGVTATDLADATGLGRSAVTKMLAKLEQAGQVIRTDRGRDSGRRSPTAGHRPPTLTAARPPQRTAARSARASYARWCWATCRTGPARSTARPRLYRDPSQIFPARSNVGGAHGLRVGDHGAVSARRAVPADARLPVRASTTGPDPAAAARPGTASGDADRLCAYLRTLVVEQRPRKHWIDRKEQRHEQRAD